jgi:cyclophilin family peptidyl-prolyl cis-trans isomerase/HEAT repeat protein
MKHALWPFLAVVVVACSTREPLPSEPPNRWADERLWPILEAQEHRNTASLCALLKDTSATVRAATALALASVQDSTSVPCLMEALEDSVTEVRVTALFALGFIANDSTVDRMAEFSDRERDSTVHRAYQSALFLNLQRRDRFEDLRPVIFHLERNGGQERARAADAIRRMPARQWLQDSALVRRALELENDPEIRALLIRGLAALRGGGDIAMLKELALHGRTPSIRISALRTLGHRFVNEKPVALYGPLADPEPMVRAVALEQLGGIGDHLQADSVLAMLPRIDERDSLARIGTLGLLLRSSAHNHDMKEELRRRRPTQPYLRAEWLRALAHDDTVITEDSLEKIMLSGEHPAVRQVAFELLSTRVRYRSMMPRAITPDMQLREEAPFYHKVFQSGDAGLISALAEQLRMSSPEDLSILFPKVVEEKALASLHPIRDLEAIQLMQELVARRDGLPPKASSAIPFNHPIDRARLLALEQGQQYRISTSKGEIIIATDVDECPGSSLAFDSLVTAGYYNGKAFHRMVPDFVVQGGCPRGDGYGGMPWTLRTEIGRSPFTAGSVGLASAGRDTESCQFFITHIATPHLDGRYTRFGEVVEGMDVVYRLTVGDVMQRVERVD